MDAPKLTPHLFERHVYFRASIRLLVADDLKIIDRRDEPFDEWANANAEKYHQHQRSPGSQR